ncbi:unnamed protein product [Urochloa humidicola]
MSLSPQVDDDGSGDNAGAASAIVINASDLVVDAVVDPNASPRKLTSALLAVDLLTLAMDVATALYKPPRGDLFERRRLAYYLTLAGIFVAGAAEVSAAFWLSCSGVRAQNEGRRRPSDHIREGPRLHISTASRPRRGTGWVLRPELAA